MLWIFATILSGVVGAIIARKMKLSAGIMIGAMAGAACFNLLSGHGIMPREMKVFTQAMSGVFIGLRICRDDLPALRKVLFPAVISTGIMIFFCLGLSVLISTVFNIEILTALLGCAPGGIVDMTLLSIDVQAETSIISVLHIVRLVTVISIFPLLMRRFTRKLSVNIGSINVKAAEPAPVVNSSAITPPVNIRNVLFTAVVGGLCGMIGKFTGIPAGTLIFAMIGVAVFNGITSQAEMPTVVKRGVQLLAGVLIGITVTPAVVIQMQKILLPVVILLIVYFIINIALAAMLHTIYGFDITTAFLSSMPGGASDIALIAEDFGGDTARISIMHTVRTMVVIGVYPILLRFI